MLDHLNILGIGEVSISDAQETVLQYCQTFCAWSGMIYASRHGYDCNIDDPLATTMSKALEQLESSGYVFVEHSNKPKTKFEGFIEAMDEAR